MSHEKPWLTEPFIATTREEILEAAQSKYIITSVNEILEHSASFEGKLAYVGLPGQVQSDPETTDRQVISPWPISTIFLDPTTGIPCTSHPSEAFSDPTVRRTTGPLKALVQIRGVARQYAGGDAKWQGD